ncbi:type III-B CRISPR module RAMP protein Cmr1 [Natronosporangium hydrolyticum]|uniref:Type III-B CRISPR module RAMP protein Cmr1 n=1 Tax=Natronosporangium hydrolyticum TaxID=2811111 RepID=A0A895YPU4_9ACTN|nr:type III-B CRISPR module RAMP protein Cmr1 [Natronosporangium hydrolyticum]QSB16756.1 type III-B CRISPR module RAMP protein Cmr1 [Natronosporangium hydrolyticum]
MAWTTLTLKVTTPLFNGGHQPPKSDTESKRDNARDLPPGDAGVRVSSLRGTMRYWLRAIAGGKVGNQTDVLAAVESRIFGSTKRASTVALRIPEPQRANHNRQPDWCRREGARWIGYLAGQGLSKPDGRNRSELDRAFVAPDTTFRLQLRFGPDEDAAALAVAALWSLCRYGGLGARTRRGFGGLRIVDVDGELPAPWTPEALLAAAAVPSDGLGLDEHGLPPEIAQCGVALNRIVASARPEEGASSVAFEGWRDPPTYPVFGGPSIFKAGLSERTFADWSAVLGYTGEQFRWFRATETAVAAGYDPPIKTPEWLRTIHGKDRRFGLGALGLPINFKGYTVRPVAAKAHGGKKEPLRRASPLWLRPVQDTNDQWRLLSFAFLGRFLPDEVKVEVRDRNGELEVGTADVVDRSTEWIARLERDESFVRGALPR